MPVVGLPRPRDARAKLSEVARSVPAIMNSYQPSFDDLGTHLSQATFVVVDLETTGSSSADSITEIGAVKVRGGDILGEFQTLINPAGSIPPLIAVLTGITDSMVAGAPRLAQVLPAFLEFAAGSVLVAHNARFDVGFLKRAYAELGYEWPGYPVIDTVALARCVMLRDEVPNVKLGTLAAYFHATTTPEHRALADARATVDVLHALMERVGNRGVSTVEDLQEYLRQVSPQRRAKRSLAQDVPEAPGVYSFVTDSLGDGARHVLYVGKSRNLRRRVGSYFTASETRPRMEEMIRLATKVDYVVCHTQLEADVRELRMIAAHTPRYNRRSKFPQKVHWLKLTAEPYPRLALVRQVREDGATYVGPFSSRATAEQVLLALYDAYPLRQCTARLSTRKPSSRCALGDMGRCAAPCDHSVSVEDYARTVDDVRAALLVDVRPVLHAARERLTRLVAQERFEEAVAVRVRLEAYTRAVLRHHRAASVAAIPEIVAARRFGAGWEIHVVRYGRLAAAAYARPGESPQAVARLALSTAETVLPPIAPQGAASMEETEQIATWLETDGVRFLSIDGDWVWPRRIGLADSELARHVLGDAEPAESSAFAAESSIAAPHRCTQPAAAPPEGHDGRHRRATARTGGLT